MENKDITYEGCLKKFDSEKELANRQSEYYKQKEKLFNTLIHYMRMHNLEKELFDKIIENFFNSYCSCWALFSASYEWRPYGYDKHYMLNLRWIYYLITSYKVYPLVYNVKSVLNHFNACLDFSDVSHSKKILDAEINARKRWFSQRVNLFIKNNNLLS